MFEPLLTMLRRYDMLRPGDRVVCAVSGGSDSVAMLFALYLLKEKLQIQLEAAHFNHQLRGAESDRDEAFVRELCDRFDIPLHVGRGQVVAGKKGLEAAAREARYAYFETLPGKLATAHTADDNAETILMRLVRGTGLKGLGGISPVRGRIIRPMLLVTRQQVEAFLEEYCLSHVEDSSNGTDDFLRNRLRRHILPALREENPKLSENLSAMAMRLRQDEEALQYSMDFTAGLSVAEVLELPQALRSRVICGFLEHCGVREPESAHIRRVEELLSSENPSAWAAFPGGITLRREYGKLIKSENAPALTARLLACPGITDLPELGLRVVCRVAERAENSDVCFTVAPQGEIWVRSRQAGDALRLPGGSRSLKKLFIDRRIPAGDRDRIPVVVDSYGVLGVWGIGPNRDRVSKEIPAVQICFEKL